MEGCRRGEPVVLSSNYAVAQDTEHCEGSLLHSAAGRLLPVVVLQAGSAVELALPGPLHHLLRARYSRGGQSSIRLDTGSHSLEALRQPVNLLVSSDKKEPLLPGHNSARELPPGTSSQRCLLPGSSPGYH